MLDFLNIPAEYEDTINWIFLIVTGFIAWHGIRYRDAEGRTDFVRLLFGAIAAVFFFMVLMQDVLKVTTFY
jgi:hypothetical protein